MLEFAAQIVYDKSRACDWRKGGEPQGSTREEEAGRLGTLRDEGIQAFFFSRRPRRAYTKGGNER